MPSIELPFRSVGPDPAMMTTTDAGRVAPRGSVRVPCSCRAPLRIVYGDSTAAAGGTVSVGAGIFAPANPHLARLITGTFLPLSKGRLHDAVKHPRDHYRRDGKMPEHGT